MLLLKRISLTFFSYSCYKNDVNHTRTSVYVLIVTEELETWQEGELNFNHICG